MFRIKEVLKQKNITATALADKLNVSNNTITRVANETTNPSLDLLARMAKELDVDIRELFSASKGGALLNGFVEYDSNVYRILNVTDLENLLKTVRLEG